MPRPTLNGRKTPRGLGLRLSLLFLLAFPSGASAADLGTISFPNSGKPEAQAAFLRGVAAMHSFWYEEALNAFRDAEKADPDFAMACWGEAMTYNHPIWRETDVDSARKALARIHGDAPTPREQAWIAATKILFGDGDKTTRDAAYEAAMARLAAAWPGDVEAQAFHALSILGTLQRDEPDARKQIRAAAILEPLFTAHPDHPGVLHYLIHAYDDPILAPLGLRAALRYAKVAPAAHHALHMPSHIFLQLGMWDETAHSNEQSYAASKAWVAREHLSSSKRDLHSLAWLQYAYLQQHRIDDARRLLAELQGTTSEHEQSSLTRMQIRYGIETGDWSLFTPVAAHPSPTATLSCMPPQTAYGASESLTFYAAGLKALSSNDLAGAEAAAQNLASKRTKDSSIDARTAEVMQRELEGLIAVRRGKTTEGLDALAAAVKVEETLGAPSGPPDVMKPARELYGEALLGAGRSRDAAEQFRLSLRRTPNRLLSVKGMERALQAGH